ncbi:type II toxin-antitoxin system PemK/MazF family toxin [Arthrobacter sp. fls2-241-R2A-172]|uniref:type II toxin-antitoxin system PemK/MazF family toxin n=1 Tax=Arthrobacter sp. fls2-241-R2A-172 TaxID=3040325 RepID=UPI0033079CC0
MTSNLLPPTPNVVRRGQIYWVDWSPGRGSEQQGHRPALVISLDSFNKVMDTVVVAAMTTKVKESTRNGTSPVTLFLPKGDPMDVEGSVLGFQVMTVSKMRLDKLAGEISREQQLEVDKILATSFGLKVVAPATPPVASVQTGPPRPGPPGNLTRPQG